MEDKLREEIRKIREGYEEDLITSGLSAGNVDYDILSKKRRQNSERLESLIKSHTNSVLEGLLEEMPDKLKEDFSADDMALEAQDSILGRTGIVASVEVAAKIYNTEGNYANIMLDQCKSIIRRRIHD